MDATEFAGGSNTWLKADELKGRTVTLEIESVEVVEFDNERGKERKLGLHLVGKDKGIIANRTNARNLIEAFGSDTDQWIGKKITAGPNSTPLGLGFALRGLPAEDELDDEIPF